MHLYLRVSLPTISFFDFSIDKTNRHFLELDHEEISRCINWMAPFAQAVSAAGYSPTRTSSSGTSEDISNTQCHTVDIKLLELAHRQIELQDQEDISESGDFQQMVY